MRPDKYKTLAAARQPTVLFCTRESGVWSLGAGAWDLGSLGAGDKQKKQCPASQSNRHTHQTALSIWKHREQTKHTSPSLSPMTL